MLAPACQRQKQHSAYVPAPACQRQVHRAGQMLAYLAMAGRSLALAGRSLALAGDTNGTGGQVDDFASYGAKRS